MNDFILPSLHPIMRAAMRTSSSLLQNKTLIYLLFFWFEN